MSFMKLLFTKSLVITGAGAVPVLSAQLQLHPNTVRAAPASVSDPYSSNPDPDPAKNLNTDPDPGRP